MTEETIETPAEETTEEAETMQVGEFIAYKVYLSDEEMAMLDAEREASNERYEAMIKNITNAFDYLINALQQEGFTGSIVSKVEELKSGFIRG